MDHSISHKGNFCSGRQFLTEVDPEGGPVIRSGAYPQCVSTAIFRCGDTGGIVGYSFKAGILFLALTGKQQLSSNSFKIEALVEIEGNLFRLLTFFKEGADQIVNVEHIGDIFPVLFVFHKLNGHIANTGKIVDAEARHH